ncbi:Increased rDNA silencing protein 4 [Penicillium oxalicum]|uniref:Increased rDNA silencing protein 4 n=1 Tax=Penicillium oxalicum TaxID=69781 RepID=UPI0020B6F8BC|nr:Increased rDNA silencing protein 4 [Penicillium oxalicum]KAI2789814.1 Increased rDNA silencing protein 4 [Penicillium oxalicum]
MDAKIAAGNPRLTSPTFRDTSALRGATIAFANSSRASQDAAHNRSTFTERASASNVNRYAHRRTEMESDQGPEVGSVKDKIGLFTRNNTLSPPLTPTRSSSPSPGQIAARLAVERSPSRAQEATVAMATARTITTRTASRMSARAPEERQELRAPTSRRPRANLQDSSAGTINRAEVVYTDIESEAEPPQRGSSLPPRVASVRISTASPRPPERSRKPPSSQDGGKLQLPPRTAPSISTTRTPNSAGIPSIRSSTPSVTSASGLSQTSSSTTVNELGGMDEEALSNAIVASSLASARASPTTKLAPPPPPSRRRARSRSILQFASSSQSEPSRSLSPTKGMPMTLRGRPKDEEAESHRRYKINLLHKHPHKHHEGDRKRWKREVTEKERKRYEGVWASNRGLFVSADRELGRHRFNGYAPGPIPADMVLNLVAREIWSRSRLPPATLAQVWDLVDSQQIGLLTKEEFVVGMWLIDQLLRGHKLPVKVPDTIWDSVRFASGIKLTSVGPKG